MSRAGAAALALLLAGAAVVAASRPTPALAQAPAPGAAPGDAADDDPEDDPHAPLGPSTLSPVRAVACGPDDPVAAAGSRSVGLTDRGFLFGGVELPVEGLGYRVLPRFRERRLNFATAELVAALRRAAIVVRVLYPDSVMQVGNLSGRYGGGIRYSRSHENGRDADVLFFASDAQGRPALPEELLRYGCDLRARTDQRVFFDVPRNWTLMAALLTDPTLDVQVVFVAKCLRGALLRHAEETGVPPALRARAAAVMRGPSRGSYAHDDHFHIRVYCTRDDLLTGCLDEGPIRSWARVHAGVLAAEDAALAAALDAPAPADREAALRRIAALDRKGLATAVLERLDDPDPAVRAAALDTTAALATPAAERALRARLLATRDPATVLAILEALRAFEQPHGQTTALLEAIAARPAAALPAPLSEADAITARARACDALAVLGRRATPDVLLPLLDDPAAPVREAAERALSWLTNHAEALPPDTAPAARRAAWTAWWAKARRLGAERRLRAGFLEAGVTLPESLFRFDAAVPLVPLVRRGGHLSWNAQQVLRRFARDVAPRVPHDRPELAWELWRAWLGSRLPQGGLETALP